MDDWMEGKMKENLVKINNQNNIIRDIKILKLLLQNSKQHHAMDDWMEGKMKENLVKINNQNNII